MKKYENSTGYLLNASKMDVTIHIFIVSITISYVDSNCDYENGEIRKDAYQIQVISI